MRVAQGPCLDLMSIAMIHLILFNEGNSKALSRFNECSHDSLTSLVREAQRSCSMNPVKESPPHNERSPRVMPYIQ